MIMTNEEKQPGAVFAYPYLWGHEEDEGLEQSKNRTVCMAVKAMGQGGISFYVIVAISDQLIDGVTTSIEIPEIEIRRGGLNFGRKAYAHINECNIDPLHLSWNNNPNVRPLGRFGKTFTEKIVNALARNLRAGSLRRIERYKAGDHKR